MNPLPPTPIQDDEAWAMRVETTARRFAYPQTPDLAPGVQKALRRQRRPIVVQRLVQAGVVLLLILTVMMAAPSLRAAILDSLRVGAISLFFGRPTPAPIPTALFSATNVPELTPLQSALNLPGEITLDRAREKYDSMVKLPTYPTSLGPPNHVYDTPMLTFVWTEPNQPSRAQLVLGILKSATTGAKFFPWEPQLTRAGDAMAYWSTEPHMLILFPPSVSGSDIQRQVSTHTLIWYDNVYTYRLETGGDEAEAVQIAESLR
jgi:hypothetical protein